LTPSSITHALAEVGGVDHRAPRGQLRSRHSGQLGDRALGPLGDESTEQRGVERPVTGFGHLAIAGGPLRLDARRRLGRNLVDGVEHGRVVLAGGRARDARARGQPAALDADLPVRAVRGVLESTFHDAELR
jgi:hypothetical protein